MTNPLTAEELAELKRLHARSNTRPTDVELATDFVCAVDKHLPDLIATAERAAVRDVLLMKARRALMAHMSDDNAFEVLSEINAELKGEG